MAAFAGSKGNSSEDGPTIPWGKVLIGVVVLIFVVGSAALAWNSHNAATAAQAGISMDDQARLGTIAQGFSAGILTEALVNCPKPESQRFLSGFFMWRLTGGISPYWKSIVDVNRQKMGSCLPPSDDDALFSKLVDDVLNTFGGWKDYILGWASNAATESRAIELFDYLAKLIVVH